MKFLIVDDDKSIVEAVTIGLQFQWQDAEVYARVTAKKDWQIHRSLARCYPARRKYAVHERLRGA